MDIRYSTITEESPCNFCKRGKIAEGGRSLVFPYKEVLVVRGKSVSVVFCEECFNELKEVSFDNQDVIEGK